MDIAVLIRERLNALGATSADAELVDELVTDLSDRFDDRRRAGLGENEASAAILAELDDPAVLTQAAGGARDESAGRLLRRPSTDRPGSPARRATCRTPSACCAEARGSWRPAS